MQEGRELSSEAGEPLPPFQHEAQWCRGGILGDGEPESGDVVVFLLVRRYKADDVAAAESLQDCLDFLG